MRSFLAFVLALLVPISVVASDTSYKVTYDGGSLTDLKSGTGLHMYIEQKQVRFVRDGKEVSTVPASAITEISYGQDVHRRVGNQAAADYTIVLNHIEHGFVRDNQIQVANKDGDLISKTKEGGSIGGDMKKACQLILADWDSKIR